MPAFRALFTFLHSHTSLTVLWVLKSKRVTSGWWNYSRWSRFGCLMLIPSNSPISALQSKSSDSILLRACLKKGMLRIGFNFSCQSDKSFFYFLNGFHWDQLLAGILCNGLNFELIHSLSKCENLSNCCFRKSSWMWAGAVGCIVIMKVGSDIGREESSDWNFFVEFKLNPLQIGTWWVLLKLIEI